MSRKSSLLRLPAILCLLLAAASAAAVPPIPDLREIEHQNIELAALMSDIEKARRHMSKRVDALERQLAQEERTLATDAVNPDLLREARLDLDTVQARLVVIEGRREQRRLALTRIDGLLERLSGRIKSGGVITTGQLRAEVAHDLLTEQAALVRRIIAAYERLISGAQRQRALLAQRLRLLQSRLSLDAISREGLFEQDPRLPLLESVIADHLRRATRLGTRLQGIEGDDADARARRRMLNVRLDDAVLRSFLRQNDLELIRAGQALDDLRALRDDDLMPLHVLTAAESRLAGVAAGLEQAQASLQAQRSVLDARRTSLRREGGDDAPELSLLDDLEQLVGFQQADIDALLTRLDTERNIFERIIADRYAASLFQYRPLPATAVDWRRLRDNALRLPALLGSAVRDIGDDFVDRIDSTGARHHALAIGGGLAVALVMLWGRRSLFALADRQSPGSRMAVVERPFARVLPLLIPAAVWLLAGLVYGVGADALWPPVLLLVLVPALAFVLGVARAILYAREPEDDVEDARDRFYARLRLGLILATLISAVFIVTRTLPVAPILADLLNRLAMLGVLALALPAFALRDLLLWLGRRGPARFRPRMALLAWVSRAVPVFLLVTGGIGLAGFLDLAWALLTYLAHAVVIGLLLFLIVGILIDIRDRLGERVGDHAELGDFWRTHFVEPGYRVGVLLSTLGAGWLLLRLWDWNDQTPLVRGFLAAIRTPIFRLGESAFTIADVLLVVILVAGAFYIGGWSQQVSYNLTYRRIRDAGLRQALATFTQYVVIVAGVLLALKVIGFDLTTLTVFAASLGVGIGFGLQNIINNFVSGILLLAERPLKVGDFVSIGSNLGSVTRIGIRSLTVRTLDKQEVIIPNGSVISGEFTNWTRSDDVLRHVLYIGIRYGDDAELALDLIRQVIDEHPHVLKDPEPGVFLWEYAESAVNIRLQYCFSMNDGPGGLVIRSDLLLAIGKRFKENGISIPFPQRDVTMHLGGDSRAALAGLAGRGALEDHGDGLAPIQDRNDARLEPPDGSA